MNHDTAVDLLDANHVVAADTKCAAEPLVIGFDITAERQRSAGDGMRCNGFEGVVGQHLTGRALAPSPPGNQSVVNHSRHLRTNVPRAGSVHREQLSL